MLEDKILKCKACGQDFVFTSGEQEFYAQKGFENEPVRCAPCRQARKKERRASGDTQFGSQDSRGEPPVRAAPDADVC
jgi:hypothetical protein